MEEKKVIRKQIFAKRKEASDAQIGEWSQIIADKVTALDEFKNASCIYAYIDYNREVCTRPIIEAAWKAGKKVAVPKVDGYGGGFYDRFLEKYPEHPTVAVAFEFQIVEAAPYEDIDILPGKVVTEKNIYE